MLKGILYKFRNGGDLKRIDSYELGRIRTGSSRFACSAEEDD